MPSVNISSELYNTLSERAKEEELSVAEFAEGVLKLYLDGEFEPVYYPDPQELAELQEAAAQSEAEEAAGIEITLEEVLEEIQTKLAERKRIVKASA